MTVKELISKLSVFAGEKDVVLFNGEYFKTAKRVSEVSYIKTPEKEDTVFDKEYISQNTVKAVVIL